MFKIGQVVKIKDYQLMGTIESLVGEIYKIKIYSEKFEINWFYWREEGDIEKLTTREEFLYYLYGSYALREI